jgi:putative ABC transport system ATP-binding protein
MSWPESAADSDPGDTDPVDDHAGEAGPGGNGAAGPSVPSLAAFAPPTGAVPAVASAPATAVVPAPPTALSRLRRLVMGAPGHTLVAAADHRQKDVIVVENVVKTYSLGDIAVHALQGVSLTIERGDFVAIMGASGSGKSTLMNILGCLDLPSRGRYLLDGVDVRGMSEDELSDVRNRKIGFVFQSFNLIPRTAAIANVELPLVYGGLRSKSERRKRAEKALRLVGLDARMHHLPSELSGGQQQRVAVARAIATNPAMILADEPTGNLDTKSTGEVLEIFGKLNADGRTVVMITHEDDVARHSKRVIRLIDGKIVDDHRLGPVAGPPPLYHVPTSVERAAHVAARSTV